jgi:RNA polymerase-binding protein DksA
MVNIMAKKKIKSRSAKKKIVQRSAKKTGPAKKRMIPKVVRKTGLKRPAKTKMKLLGKPVRKPVLKTVKRTKGKIIKRFAAKTGKKVLLMLVKKESPKPRLSLAKQKLLQRYKKILIEKRRHVMEGIEKLRESAKGTESENISKYYDHPAEYGTDTMDREQYFLFISREEKYLLEIERSLESIESGEYGTCRVCGKPIDKARLEAVPTTRICITCKMADQKARVSKTDLS